MLKKDEMLNSIGMPKPDEFKHIHKKHKFQVGQKLHAKQHKNDDKLKQLKKLLKK